MVGRGNEIYRLIPLLSKAVRGQCNMCWSSLTVQMLQAYFPRLHYVRAWACPKVLDSSMCCLGLEVSTTEQYRSLKMKSSRGRSLGGSLGASGDLPQASAL